MKVWRVLVGERIRGYRRRTATYREVMLTSVMIVSLPYPPARHATIALPVACSFLLTTVSLRTLIFQGKEQNCTKKTTVHDRKFLNNSDDIREGSTSTTDIRNTPRWYGYTSSRSTIVLLYCRGGGGGEKKVF